MTTARDGGGRRQTTGTDSPEREESNGGGGENSRSPENRESEPVLAGWQRRVAVRGWAYGRRAPANDRRWPSDDGGRGGDSSLSGDRSEPDRAVF